MKYIDTHSHLYLEEFNNDREEIISRALGAGVTKILLPNIDKASVSGMLEMAHNYPGICYPMIGIHPTSVKEDYLEQLESVKYWLTRDRFIAIGEIGIDLYWEKEFLRQQTEIFKAQVELALANNLPVVIHARESFTEIFNLLKEYRGSGLTGVFHAFTGDTGQAEFIIDLGLYIGIGGIVTFKNSGLDKVVADIGIQKILLETDSPYLAPTPYRGKRNESAYIPMIAQKIADVTHLSLKEVAEITSINALSLFNLEV
jgi:TatD DNase family protein